MSSIVYILIDPNTYEIRYVGLSTIGIKRTRQHLCPSRLKANTHKNRWIKSLLYRRQKPIVKAVQVWDNIKFKDLGEAEKYWIFYFRSIGCPLTNLTDGGEGTVGLKCSEETKRKISKATRGTNIPQKL